jgi:hypothetical protein
MLLLLLRTEGFKVVVSGGVSLNGGSNIVDGGGIIKPIILMNGGGIVDAPQNIFSNNAVTTKFLGTTADYTSILYLAIDDNRSNDIAIFDSQNSTVNSTFSLGNFANGKELKFRLHVKNTGMDFFTGTSHARVQQNYGGSQTTLVSFEDSDDFDYNDLSFSVTPTQSGFSNVPQFAAAESVPEPFTIIGTLIGGTAAFRMKKKLANSDKA